ncbi:substrate-binding periplasmic protein [Undibacterium sp. Dicai25W]|uniref:substrate-binding periplasmic protein n=1 Tax=Undibacterium sp. Dicai25W TaxID=3413034 RepID=UPI003BF11B73
MRRYCTRISRFKSVSDGFAFLVLLCLTAFSAAQDLTIYTEDWPPINFKTVNAIDGMAVDLVRALQSRIGVSQEIHLVPWARGYKAVLEEPNVMLFSVGRTPEREKLMRLLGPIAISDTVLYTRKGSAERLRSLRDGIYALPVGAYRSSIFVDVARKKGFQHIEQANSPQIEANMLLAGRFDMLVESSVAINQILKGIGHTSGEIEKVAVLDSLELYLAFSLNTSPEILNAWESALRAAKKDGSFQKIYQKWFPDEMPPMDVQRLGPADRL